MSKVQYDTTVIRKDDMYTVSHELCHMEYSRIMNVMYHYCLLDDMYVIVAIVKSMPLKYDTT